MNNKKEKINKALFTAKGVIPGKPRKKAKRDYLKKFGRYATTAIGGGTTIGGVNALGERDENKYKEAVGGLLEELLHVEEKLMQFSFDDVKAPNKKQQDELYKKAKDLEAKIGKEWVDALPRYVNWDGSPINPDTLPPNKQEQLPTCEDPSYELQWW